MRAVRRGGTACAFRDRGREAALALIAERAGGGALPPAERERLLLATVGNPLAIRELWADEPDGHADPRAPIALADGLRSAFSHRVQRRSPAARRLLLLIAADGTGRVDVLDRAHAELAGGERPRRSTTSAILSRSPGRRWRSGIR
ncbi:hypothetical protein [Actinomadura sp. 3N407]|uniref:hypothetical protein n=1 Tax=Actinomadura sp. 3N407 TaxID=3457423 RepID=UPI003FCC8D3C